MVKLQLKIYQTKKKSHLKIHYPPSFPHEYNKLKAQQASAEIQAAKVSKTTFLVGVFFNLLLQFHTTMAPETKPGQEIYSPFSPPPSPCHVSQPLYPSSLTFQCRSAYRARLYSFVFSSTLGGIISVIFFTEQPHINCPCAKKKARSRKRNFLNQCRGSTTPFATRIHANSPYKFLPHILHPRTA